MQLKSAKKENKDSTLGFKVTNSERELIQKLADKYTNSNISTWIRFAALNFEPKREHLTGDRSEKK